MAEIHVNNTRIPAVGMVQRIRSGMFTPDFLGDYSYPLTVPNTEEVAVALGLPADPQSATDFGELIPADLYVRHNRRYRGKIEVLDADEDSVELVFVLQSGFFIADNTTLKVRDCYAPEDTITLDQPVETLGGYRIRCAHGNARLTLNGAVFDMKKDDYENQEEQLYALADWIESLPFLGLTVQVVISEEGHSSASYIEYWDNLNPTTALMQQMPGGGVNRSYIATPREAKRLQMGSYNTPDQANRIAFPQLYHPGLYEGANPVFDGIVNRYDDQGRLDIYNPAYFGYSDAMQWVNTLIPFLYLTDVVKTIFAHLNIQCSGEFLEDPRIQRLLLYNNRTLDFVQISQGATVVRRNPSNVDAGDNDPAQVTLIYENVHDFNIRLRRHAPDMDVVAFLKALKNAFFLKYDFDLIESRVEIRYTRSVIRSREVLDLTHTLIRGRKISHSRGTGLRFSYAHKDNLVSRAQPDTLPEPDHTVGHYPALQSLDADIDDIAYVQSLSAYFRLKKDRDDPATWELYAFDLRDDPDIPEALDWPLEVTPLVDAYVDGKKLPAIEGAAHNPDVNLFQETEGLRITAFYGQQTAGSGPYAFAAANGYDAQGNADSAQDNLYVRSPQMQPLWQDLHHQLRAARKEVKTLLLSEAEVQALVRTRPIRLQNILYLLDQTELPITDRDPVPATLTLYKLKT